MSQGLCPSCGAAVNLTADQNEVSCTYCATMVKRPEAEAQFDEVKNSKIGGTLLIAQTAQEGGSYAEAITYYNKVIEQQADFSDGWLNKGICMVRVSKIGDIKMAEAMSSWKAAIKFAKHPEAMKRRVATEINNVVSDFYPVLEDHFLRFYSVEDSLDEHMERFLLLDNALALASEFDPSSKTIPLNGIALCDRFLGSVREASKMQVAAAKEKENNADKNGIITLFNLFAPDGSDSPTVREVKKIIGEKKQKYIEARIKNDPECAAKIYADREVAAAQEERAATRSQLATAAKAAKGMGGPIGCGLVAFVLLVIVMGVIPVAVIQITEGEEGAWIGLITMIIIFVLPMLIGFWVFKEALRKRKSRDTSWIQDLPACFGQSDRQLALHPSEEKRFKALLLRALSAGFSVAAIRSEVVKFGTTERWTQAHLKAQCERYDSLIKGWGL